MNETALSARSPWLVSRRFDLALFFGGAPLALAMMVAVLGGGLSIVALTWVWILLGDGPHMFATLSRSYLDGECLRGPHARLLRLSPLAFLVGPLALLGNVLLGSEAPFTLFLLISGLLSVHHVVRQHWGFLSLYWSKSGEQGRDGLLRDELALYGIALFPYLHFLASHPRVRAATGLPEPPVVLLALLVVLSVASALAFLAGNAGRLGAPRTQYFMVFAALQAILYFGVARLEPVYPEAVGPEQEFLLMAVMAATFHSVQYTALVYVHNRGRYLGPDAAPLARSLASSPLRYLAAALLFSAGYALFSASAAIYPGFTLLTGKVLGPHATANQLMVGLYWGVALHHYWLDRRLWRPNQDPALASALGLR